MSRLSDVEIRQAIDVGMITVDPLPTDEQIQPASVDLYIGSLAHDRLPEFPKHATVYPGEFILGSTREIIGVDHLAQNPSICAEVKGKSSFARRGLMVECAGFIDPGFYGQITLEIKNMSDDPIEIYSDDLICQIVFTRLGKPAQYGYGSVALNSHYHGQMGVTESWHTRNQLRAI